jgi:poly(ADP-ribose) glycohydrolase ARH3
MSTTVDQFTGCLLGLALGDAHGAPHEGGVLERFVWRFIGTTKAGELRWTDDTQMSLDIAESLVERGCLDLDDIAARFAKSYRWSRGYGPGAAKILAKIRRGNSWRESNRSVYPGGSYGNGGAMRAPVIGLAFGDCPERLITAARATAEITHAHPLGIEGAVIIAVATSAALSRGTAGGLLERAIEVAADEQFQSRLKTARTWLAGGRSSAPADIRRELGTAITAPQSCVTALYLAAIYLDKPFEELIQFAVDCGGDVDTIAAMAGGIWGAANGAAKIPSKLLNVLEDRDRIRQAATNLYHGRASL